MTGQLQCWSQMMQEQHRHEVMTYPCSKMISSPIEVFSGKWPPDMASKNFPAVFMGSAPHIRSYQIKHWVSFVNYGLGRIIRIYSLTNNSLTTECLLSHWHPILSLNLQFQKTKTVMTEMLKVGIQTHMGDVVWSMVSAEVACRWTYWLIWSKQMN